MRLQLILPRVDPQRVIRPMSCPHCGGRYLRLHQVVSKPLRDTVYPQVKAYRYQCLRCQRTWRIYPQGVSGSCSSQRVRGLAILLYLLGLSYGATSLALEALGVYLCKTSVYEAVQAAAERVPGMRQGGVFGGIRTPALGADVTTVRCGGKWLPLGLSVDDTTGLVLTVDGLAGRGHGVAAGVADTHCGERRCAVAG
jgi:transposase-like protein